MWTVTAVIGLPALYMMSFAPLNWLDWHGYIKSDSVAADACLIYAAPIRVAHQTGPKLLRDVLNWYERICR